MVYIFTQYPNACHHPYYILNFLLYLIDHVISFKNEWESQNVNAHSINLPNLEILFPLFQIYFETTKLLFRFAICLPFYKMGLSSCFFFFRIGEV